MSDLAEAWRQIALEDHSGSGWVVRRVYPDRPTRIQAAIRKPDDALAILFEIASSSLPSVASLPDCIGFHLSVEVLKPGPGGNCRLCLTLKEQRYRDVFETLAEDVAKTVSQATTETEGVRLLLGRLNTWERFLDRFGVNLLSQEEQAGLFAELKFLESELLPIQPAMDAVRSWRGPYRAPQDFLHGSMAVEIKSTTSRNPASFKVASLEQLDRGSLSRFLLHHSALSIDEVAGTSLPDLVSGLRKTIAETDPGAASQFDASLIEAGYLEAHDDAYRERAFLVLQQRWFEVREGFPLLAPATVPPGVAAARYTISLAACAPYELNTETAREILKAGMR